AYPRLARLSDVDDESFRMEASGEKLRGLPVILDQKKAHRNLSYRRWQPAALREENFMSCTNCRERDRPPAARRPILADELTPVAWVTAGKKLERVLRVRSDPFHDRLQGREGRIGHGLVEVPLENAERLVILPPEPALHGVRGH